MLQFMQDGGALMWPILIAGVLTILTAVRKATVGAIGALSRPIAASLSAPGPV
jgi:hypothetical protein